VRVLLLRVLRWSLSAGSLPVRCGDRGHTKADGTPCLQPIPKNAPACVWHSRTPEERRVFAARGAGASLLKAGMATRDVLPPDTTPLAVDSVAAIDQQIVEELQRVRTGKLSERRGQIVVDTLLKLRTTKAEEAPKGGVNVSIGTYRWSLPLAHCPECGYEAKRESNGTDRAPQTDVENPVPVELADDLDGDVVPMQRFRNMARRRTA